MIYKRLTHQTAYEHLYIKTRRVENGKLLSDIL